MDLAPGVHDLALTFDRGEDEMTIHPAVVETPRGLLLVDVGLDLEVLRAGFDAQDLDLGDVHTVVLTHQDGDHVAATAPLLKEIEATIAAHREATPYIDGQSDLVKGDRRYDPVGVDLELCEGVRFRTDAGPMEILFTPGHSPGHICLYFPDHGLLLAADAVTARDGALAGPLEDMTPEWEEAMGSVDQLAAYDIHRILCYHGGAVPAGSADLDRIATEG